MKKLTIILLFSTSAAFSQYEDLQLNAQKRYTNNKIAVSATSAVMSAGTYYTGTKASFRQPFNVVAGAWAAVVVYFIGDFIQDKIKARKIKRSINKYYAGKHKQY